MSTVLLHIRNQIEPPKDILVNTKYPKLTKYTLGNTKVTLVNRKIRVGTKEKKIVVKKGNKVTKEPMYTKVLTHVYTGRTKEFYDNPEWRAKAEEIRAQRKKPFAKFMNGV